MVHIVRLTREGNSYSIRVPRPIVAELGWARGDTFGLALEEGRVVLRRLDERALVAAEAPARPVSVRRGGAR